MDQLFTLPKIPLDINILAHGTGLIANIDTANIITQKRKHSIAKCSELPQTCQESSRLGTRGCSQEFPTKLFGLIGKGGINFTADGDILIIDIHTVLRQLNQKRKIVPSSLSRQLMLYKFKRKGPNLYHHPDFTPEGSRLHAVRRSPQPAKSKPKPKSTAKTAKPKVNIKFKASSTPAQVLAQVPAMVLDIADEDNDDVMGFGFKEECPPIHQSGKRIDMTAFDLYVGDILHTIFVD